MGYVETEQADVFRDSLIGLSPLIAGTLFVAYAGMEQMQLRTLWDVLRNGQIELFWLGLGMLPAVPDFYVWFYLTFVISSAMMPSQSDRHAWLPLGLWSAVMLALAILSGAGVWMLENLAPLLDDFLNSVALLMGLSNAMHVALLIPFFLFHRLLVYILQVDVE